VFRKTPDGDEFSSTEVRVDAGPHSEAKSEVQPALLFPASVVSSGALGVTAPEEIQQYAGAGAGSR
jgi:hypothetical protein